MGADESGAAAVRVHTVVACGHWRVKLYSGHDHDVVPTVRVWQLALPNPLTELLQTKDLVMCTGARVGVPVGAPVGAAVTAALLCTHFQDHEDEARRLVPARGRVLTPGGTPCDWAAQWAHE